MSRTKRNPPTFLPIWYDLEVHMFEDYFDFMEAQFENQLNKIEKEYNEFISNIDSNDENISEEYRDYLEDGFIEDSWKIQEVFVRNFRYSQAIQLFSYLEVRLRKSCDRYAHFYKKEYRIKDLKGQDFDKIKLFLKKSVGINISDLEPSWSFINRFKEVRNCIVHHNGVISIKDQQRYKAINNISKNNFDLEEIQFLETRHTNGEVSRTTEKYRILFNDPKFFKIVLNNIQQLFHSIEKSKPKKNIDE